jgi:hypothetical protein
MTLDRLRQPTEIDVPPAHPLRIHHLTAAMIYLALNSGCAVLANGTTQLVRIDAQPPGARVEVNDRVLETPATVALQRAQSHPYRVVRPGCRPAEGIISSQGCATAWCLVDIAGAMLIVGIPSLLVDAHSGALAELTPSTVNVVLEGCP